MDNSGLEKLGEDTVKVIEGIRKLVSVAIDPNKPKETRFIAWLEADNALYWMGRLCQELTKGES